MIDQRLINEIAKQLKITSDRVVDAIDNSHIEVYKTKEDAYLNVMGLNDIDYSDLIDFILNLVNGKTSNKTLMQDWLDNYDGIINTPFGVAYVNELFYE